MSINDDTTNPRFMMTAPDEIAAANAEHERERALCDAVGHLAKDDGQIGFGFGFLDYYCSRCQRRIASVSVADMNDHERRMVGVLAGDTIGRFLDLEARR